MGVWDRAINEVIPCLRHLYVVLAFAIMPQCFDVRR